MPFFKGYRRNDRSPDQGIDTYSAENLTPELVRRNDRSPDQGIDTTPPYNIIDCI